MAFRIEETGVFRDLVTFLNAKLNDGCVKKATVEDGAGIEATKLEHQHRAIWAKESDTTAVAEDHVIHVVKGTAGTLKSFKAGCVVASTDADTITVDLHKNGVSVLVAAIVIDDEDAAYALVEGTIDTAAVVAGDVLEVVVTIQEDGGDVGKGVFAYLDLHEDVS